MTIDKFIKETGTFNSYTKSPMIIWNGYKVYKVWNEHNGKPVPTGPPFYALEDKNGNFRYTNAEESFEILPHTRL